MKTATITFTEKEVLSDISTHKWLIDQILDSYNADIVDRLFDAKMLVKVLEERLK